MLHLSPSWYFGGSVCESAGNVYSPNGHSVGHKEYAYCTTDSTPYPADESSIVYMLPSDLTELIARGVASTATAAQMAASKHCGSPLVITVD